MMSKSLWITAARRVSLWALARDFDPHKTRPKRAAIARNRDSSCGWCSVLPTMPALRLQTLLPSPWPAVGAGNVFSRRAGRVRAEWQEWRKTPARLQRIAATVRGSRWQVSERRQAGRWFAHVRRLLVGVGEPQQLVLAPGAAGEGEAERIVRRLLVADAARSSRPAPARWDSPPWPRSPRPRRRGTPRRRACAGSCRRRGRAPWRPAGPWRAPDLYSSSDRSPLVACDGEEQVLAEAQAPVGVGLVEGDDVGHRLDLGAGRPVAQVEIEVVLQLVEEHDRRRRRDRPWSC